MRPLTAREFERASLSWSADQFEAFVRVLVGSAASEIAGVPAALPSPGERSRDGGVDSWFQLRVPDQPYAAGSLRTLVDSGLNVYQVKWRDPARGRTQVLQELVRLAEGKKPGVTPEVTCIESKLGSAPDRLVFVTNIAFGEVELRQIEAAYRSAGGSTLKKTRIVALGASDLVNVANRFPHLQSFFDEAGPFLHWEAALARHNRREEPFARIDLVGREPDLEQLERVLLQGKTRSIVVRGPAGIGKSRLVLEATRQSAARVLVAEIASDVTEQHLKQIEAESKPVVVVLDDLPPEQVQSWLSRAAGLSMVVLVITTRGSGGGGADLVLALDRLDDSHAETLLRSASPGLDIYWLVRLRDDGKGNPRELLCGAAAQEAESAGPRLKLEARYASDAKQGLSDSAQRVLETLALFSRADIGDGGVSDLLAIAKFCEISPVGVQEAVRELEMRGRVSKRGRWVEVVPRSAAIGLGRDACRAAGVRLWSLFAGLDSANRRRLCRRLGEIDESGPFWDSLLVDSGPFGSPGALLDSVELLGPAVRLRAEAVIGMLQRVVGTATNEELVELAEAHRLLDVIEALTDRDVFFSRASSILLQLATHQAPSRWSNDARTRWRLLFALGLLRGVEPRLRAEILEAAFRSGVEARRTLAIEAASAALSNEVPLVPLRGDLLTDLTDPGVRRWPLEVWRAYARSVWSVLERAPTLGADQETVQVNQVRYLNALADGAAAFGLHAEAIERLQPMLNKLPADLSGRAQLKPAVERILESARGIDNDNGAEDPELVHRIEAVARSVEKPIDSPATQALAVLDPLLSHERRAQRDLELIDPDSTTVQGLRAAASCFYGSGKIGTAVRELFVALSNEREWDVRVPVVIFFEELGRLDAPRQILLSLQSEADHPLVLESLRAYLRGRDERPVFESVFGSSRDRQREAAFEALVSLEPRSWTLELVLIVLRTARVGYRFAIAALAHSRHGMNAEVSWLTTMLGLFDTEDPEIAECIVRLCGLRQHHRGDLDPLFGVIERALSACQLRDAHGMGGFYWDRLAAAVAQQNQAAGFVLFDHALNQAGTSRPSSVKQLWRTLLTKNRAQSLNWLLERIARPDSVLRYRSLAAELMSAVDLESDAEILLTFAAKSEDNAWGLTYALPVESSGYWAFIARLLTVSPGSHHVEAGLLAQIGSYAGWVEENKRTLEARLTGANSLVGHSESRVSRFARVASSTLRDALGRYELYDYDLDDQDLREQVKSAWDDERRWAMRHVLRHLDRRRIWEFLEFEDLERELPHLGLSDDERSTWEAALESWKRQR